MDYASHFSFHFCCHQRQLHSWWAPNKLHWVREGNLCTGVDSHRKTPLLQQLTTEGHSLSYPPFQEPSFSSTFSTEINTRDASSHTVSSSAAKRQSNILPELNNSPMNFSQRHYTSIMEDATYTPGDWLHHPPSKSSTCHREESIGASDHTLTPRKTRDREHNRLCRAASQHACYNSQVPGFQLREVCR